MGSLFFMVDGRWDLVGEREGRLVLVEGLEGLLDRLVVAVQDGVECLVAKDVAGDQRLEVGDNDVV